MNMARSAHNSSQPLGQARHLHPSQSGKPAPPRLSLPGLPYFPFRTVSGMGTDPLPVGDRREVVSLRAVWSGRAKLDKSS